MKAGFLIATSATPPASIDVIREKVHHLYFRTTMAAAYITSGTAHILRAVDLERAGDLDAAFEARRRARRPRALAPLNPAHGQACMAGVQVLLAGAQGDPDPRRQVAVRAKVDTYLTLAERLKTRQATSGAALRRGPLAALQTPQRERCSIRAGAGPAPVGAEGRVYRRPA